MEPLADGVLQLASLNKLTVRRLAKRLGVTDRMARTWIQRLERDGVVVRIGTERQSIVWGLASDSVTLKPEIKT